MSRAPPAASNRPRIFASVTTTLPPDLRKAVPMPWTNAPASTGAHCPMAPSSSGLSARLRAREDAGCKGRPGERFTAPNTTRRPSMSDNAQMKRAFIITNFSNVGTGENFIAGATPMIEEGAYGNYAAAGLVREPTDEEVKRPDPIDYDRDGLADLALDKANKEQLAAIAAHEQADVPEGDKATKADLIKAIEAAREAKRLGA